MFLNAIIGIIWLLSVTEAQKASCAGFCGGENINAGCWCDEYCSSYGDCCSDIDELCDFPDSGTAWMNTPCDNMDGCTFSGGNGNQWQCSESNVNQKTCCKCGGGNYLKPDWDYNSTEDCAWDYGVPGTLNPVEGDFRRELIVNGGESDFMEYGWFVSLNYPGSCGGTLIHREWVITAAHCISESNPVSTVVLGYNNLQATVTHVFCHPQYDGNALVNDICLLHIEPLDCATAEELGIQAIQILDIDFDFEDCAAFIIGAGALSETDNGSLSSSDIVMEVIVEANDICDHAYYGKLPPTQMCAWHPTQTTKDSCYGDSGGPLVIDIDTSNSHRYALVGAVSYGQVCGGGDPGVYTDLPEFKEFIKAVVGENVINFANPETCDKRDHEEGPCGDNCTDMNDNEVKDPCADWEDEPHMNGPCCEFTCYNGVVEQVCMSCEMCPEWMAWTDDGSCCGSCTECVMCPEIFHECDTGCSSCNVVEDTCYECGYAECEDVKDPCADWEDEPHMNGPCCEFTCFNGVVEQVCMSCEMCPEWMAWTDDGSCCGLCTECAMCPQIFHECDTGCSSCNVVEDTCYGCGYAECEDDEDTCSTCCSHSDCPSDTYCAMGYYGSGGFYNQCDPIGDCGKWGDEIEVCPETTLTTIPTTIPTTKPTTTERYTTTEPTLTTIPTTIPTTTPTTTEQTPEPDTTQGPDLYTVTTQSEMTVGNSDNIEDVKTVAHGGFAQSISRDVSEVTVTTITRRRSRRRSLGQVLTLEFGFETADAAAVATVNSIVSDAAFSTALQEGMTSVASALNLSVTVEAIEITEVTLVEPEVDVDCSVLAKKDCKAIPDSCKWETNYSESYCRHNTACDVILEKQECKKYEDADWDLTCYWDKNVDNDDETEDVPCIEYPTKCEYFQSQSLCNGEEVEAGCVWNSKHKPKCISMDTPCTDFTKKKTCDKVDDMCKYNKKFVNDDGSKGECFDYDLPCTYWNDTTKAACKVWSSPDGKCKWKTSTNECELK